MSETDNEILKAAIEKGVFNISDLDKYTIAKLLNLKQDFSLSLSTLTFDEAYNQLRDLSLNIKQILEKYLSGETLKEFSKIEINGSEYDFYSLYNSIPYCKNLEDIRLLWNYINLTFDKFLKDILRVALPTEKINLKKKVVNSLFTLIAAQQRGALAENILKDFDMWRETNNTNKSLLNFVSFNLANVPLHDLDAQVLIIGQARSGKSTLSLKLLERIYSVKYNTPLKSVADYIIKKDFFNRNMIYSKNQSLDIVKRNFKDVIITDEAFLVADKREAMQSANILYTKLINVFANRNNIVLTNMQDFTAIDARISKKANVILLITQRGTAYAYMQKVNLPIVAQPSIFEFFEKNPHFLYDFTDNINWILQHRVRGFIGIIKWKPYAEDNPLWIAYKTAKAKYQADIEIEDTAPYRKKETPLATPERKKDLDVAEYLPPNLAEKYKAEKEKQAAASQETHAQENVPDPNVYTYKCAMCGNIVKVAKGEAVPDKCPNCLRSMLYLIAKPI